MEEEQPFDLGTPEDLAPETPEPAEKDEHPGLFGEQLLAVRGVTDFLAREHPHVMEDEHIAARRLLGDIKADLRAFMSGEEPRRLPGRPAEASPFSYLRLLEQLSQPIQPKDIEALVGSHQDGSDAVDLFIPLTRAVAYLNGIAPRRQRQTLVSTVPVMPSAQEVSRFRRIFSIVDNPMILFVRLRQGVLLSDEVNAVSSVYPELYGFIKEAVGKAIAHVLDKNDKYSPSRKVDSLLRTLIGQGPQDPKLIQDLQANYPQDDKDGQEQGPAPAPKGGKLQLKGHAYSSAGQRAESGGRS